MNLYCGPLGRASISVAVTSIDPLCRRTAVSQWPQVPGRDATPGGNAAGNQSQVEQALFLGRAPEGAFHFGHVLAQNLEDGGALIL